MNASENRGTLIFLAVVAAGGVLFLGYSFIWAPLQTYSKEIRKLEDDNADKAAQIAQIVKDKAKLAAWRRLSLAAPDTKPRPKGKDAPAQQRAIPHIQEQYVTYLRDLVTKNKLTLKVFPKPLTVDDKNAPKVSGNTTAYTSLTFSFEARGKLDGIVRMLEEFQATPLLHRARNLTIRMTEGKEAAGAPLSLTMTAEALIVNGSTNPGTSLIALTSGPATFDAIMLAARGRTLGLSLIPWDKLYAAAIAPRGHPNLTDEAVAVAREAKVPDFILAKLMPLKGQEFASRAAFVKELDKIFAQSELKEFSKSVGTDEMKRYQRILVMSASPRREYADLAMQNIFEGGKRVPAPWPPKDSPRPPPPSETPRSLPDMLTFAYLTDVTIDNVKTRASVYDRYAERKLDLRTTPGYNWIPLLKDAEHNTLVRGKVLSIDTRGIAFQVQLQARSPEEESPKMRFRSKEVIYNLPKEEAYDLVATKKVSATDTERLYKLRADYWRVLLRDKVVSVRDGKFAFYLDLLRGKVIKSADDNFVVLQLDKKYSGFRGPGKGMSMVEPHAGYCFLGIGENLLRAMQTPLDEQLFRQPPAAASAMREE